MPANIITPSKLPYIELAYSTPINFDMDLYDGREVFIADLTGNLSITTTNWQKGRRIVIHYEDNGSTRNITLPGWKCMTGALPTVTTATKFNTLELISEGATNGLVRCWHWEES